MLEVIAELMGKTSGASKVSKPSELALAPAGWQGRPVVGCSTACVPTGGSAQAGPPGLSLPLRLAGDHVVLCWSSSTTRVGPAGHALHLERCACGWF